MQLSSWCWDWRISRSRLHDAHYDEAGGHADGRAERDGEGNAGRPGQCARDEATERSQPEECEGVNAHHATAKLVRHTRLDGCVGCGEENDHEEPSAR